MRISFWGGLCLSVALVAGPVRGAELRAVRGTVPGVVSRLAATGRLAGTNRLTLAIGLPLRDPEGLSNLLRELYDPASANYHRFLSTSDFTERFGPTAGDYEAVAAYFEGRGLRVSERHANRMLLDVEGSVAEIEAALQVHLNTYAHPEENREFYAPDTEPKVEEGLPVAGISGLDNYARPRPRLRVQALDAGVEAGPNLGSGPSGTYMGKDFRAAYAPGTALTGSGQVVGLLQFDGYTLADITNYEGRMGLTNYVPLTNVLLDGYGGAPTGTGGEVEVSLDIEMAISMAPGLAGIGCMKRGRMEAGMTS